MPTSLRIHYRDVTIGEVGLPQSKEEDGKTVFSIHLAELQNAIGTDKLQPNDIAVLKALKKKIEKFI